MTALQPPRADNAREYGWNLEDDPFASPVDIQMHAAQEPPYRDTRARYEDSAGELPTEQAGPSSVSLIPDFGESREALQGRRDDDEARPGTSSSWNLTDGMDPERTATTSRSRKKRARYDSTPSPFKKTSSSLKALSRSLQRASVRVVNLAGFGLEEHVRIAEVDDDTGSGTLDDKVRVDEDDGDEDYMELPDLTRALPIRGRTLACFGPTSKLRMAMYKLLVYPWTEPLILLLIIFDAVVLTIQSHKSAALAADGSQNPPHVVGYFHNWEDCALFALFCFFTIEAFARICVSGFLLDPDVPVSSILTSFTFAAMDTAYIDSHTALSRQGSAASSHSQARLQPSRRTLTQQLQQLLANISRPFALQHHAMPYPREVTRTPSHARSDTHSPMLKTAFAPPSDDSAGPSSAHARQQSQPALLSTALRSDRPDMLALPFRVNIASARVQTMRNVPYLRHSWSRIDFVAVVSFWISFALATAGVERGSYHIGIFRAMSVLRTTRLLAITSGTTTIMRSLKTARPLLASVAYFVAYAMIMFSIIGIQAFEGSYLRSCNVLPVLGEAETNTGQNCGGYINATTLEKMPYIKQDGTYGVVKGYICPIGLVCMENSENPYSNIESFDTVYYSALQLFIVASSNGWSPIMYNMMDAEYFVSCLFFIVGIIVLNFWLINLFVAVITNTFAAIRAGTQKSAFGAATTAPAIDDNDENWTIIDGRRVSKNACIKQMYEAFRWFWVLLALLSLVLPATRTVDMSSRHANIIDYGELVLTIAFDVEIVIRFCAEFPAWRNFFHRGQNDLDLLLAIGSSIIQIPAIHDSSVYPWFTSLQLMRFYRVILEIPRMRPLLLAVFGNLYGLANMTLFLLILNFVAALIGVQLMRGDVERGQFIDYGQIYNSFLAAYQLFSSENWTNVLYGVGPPEIPLRQAPIVILYLVVWFSLANFIVFQMFIAVINENFQIAEESKRTRQASNYWASHRPQQASVPWLRKFNPYRWIKAQPKAIAVEQLPSDLVLPMQKNLVDDYTLPGDDFMPTQRGNTGLRREISRRYFGKTYIQRLHRLFTGEAEVEEMPMVALRNGRRDSSIPSDTADEEVERHLEVLATLNSEAAAEDVTDDLYERRARKADFIRDHPTYDKPFWIISQKNVIRRICQKLVVPAGGERIFGARPSPIAHAMFQFYILLAVIGGIVVEWIATPIYRRNYELQHGLIRGSWFNIAEASFGLTLVLEFIIKVIADGFIFTPNAYLRSIWNLLDFLIMAGVLSNLIAGLIFLSGLSRFTRSLKALRALRLITLIETLRSTFESLIILGVARIFDACLLAILYMIPYAVWGLNIFAGLMKECNDTSVNGVNQCIDEYSNTIYGDAFGFMVPRVWADPHPSTTFSFDNFRTSLLILFEIVSLEGWIDVMTAGVSLVGPGLQPQMNASQWNSIFFLIYNLLGGVIILTLFISIIIGNFMSKTGTAFLTQPQREWIDLQKLIKRQRPSKRPEERPTWSIRAWCYDRAVHKHGWWHRMMTILFTLHVLVLMTQTLGTTSIYDAIREDFFLLVTFFYMTDTAIRLSGLGLISFFSNGWNIFDLIVAAGSLLTTLIVRSSSSGSAMEQLQKLFVTLIAFKLVQRTDSLNKFFKTAVASLPTIMSLLGLWLILFFYFAIMYMEVFAMTKWNSAETRNENYTTMEKALVMLAFMTTGEGWNQYMHDFALEYPRCTVISSDETDCGSKAWAFTLFIAWNLLSMYIFANLFVGVVVESFYYVFQISGGAKSITREEMRAFKKVWAEFANPKTGYLQRKYFVPFFGKLSGVFEVRIYPAEYSIPSILAKSRRARPSFYPRPPRTVDGIDLDTLNLILSGIDRASIKRRKNLYNRLYHEARISYEPNKGISFTNMLLLLAHHKLIVDRDALVLKDLVVRTETNKVVTDLVDFDRVQSLLLMILYRRRYRAMREQARQQKMEEQDIPAIVVDNLMATPPAMTRDITSPGQGSDIRRFSDPESPLSLSGGSPDVSLAAESPAVSHRGRRISDISMLSLDRSPSMDLLGAHSPRSSAIQDESDEHSPSIRDSVWNEMMLAAAEEEEDT
ncbi:hypothetical protein WOLCODRAFT_106220 [Wolfiporia cocos MD-104 SS10]|uniref:Calcium-channel protein CCH1 n=1 Tax=Wolfiporia cocos (strain MD-104) TaxID=742152 RepID=A0A2H3J767_WOLCO|nr:hypothetical protein WOLCODRAFT_106220 [Wolfiporia cocos MD-104 SS10]